MQTLTDVRRSLGIQYSTKPQTPRRSYGRVSVTANVSLSQTEAEELARYLERMNMPLAAFFNIAASEAITKHCIPLFPNLRRTE